jgi:hypothetical protein
VNIVKVWCFGFMLARGSARHTRSSAAARRSCPKTPQKHQIASPCAPPLAIFATKVFIKVSNAELDAYVDLLFGEDEARAFLKIMKSFEPTPTESRGIRLQASSSLSGEP